MMIRYICPCGKTFTNAVSYYQHIHTCGVYKEHSRKLRETFVRYMRRRR